MISILIPCYNEETTIAKVIEDFHRYLPDAIIYVYDNNCTDNTMKIASKYNYVVTGRCYMQGKSATVKKMFREINSDLYILVDGDTTYSAKYVNRMLTQQLANKYDMVICNRLLKRNMSLSHIIGNKLVNFLIRLLYYKKIPDVMTGYRLLTRDFVKNIDIKSKGFELETEMTIYAITNNYKIGSIPIKYNKRPKESKSKIHTIKDGYRILKFILKSKRKEY